MKMLVRYLIGKAIERRIIRKEQFNTENADAFVLRDDVWLWSVLRSMEADSETTRMIQRAVFYREKKNVLNLWKTRPAYHALHKAAGDRVDAAVAKVEDLDAFRGHLNRHMSVPVLLFEVEFRPLGSRAVPLYSEAKKGLTDKHLLEVSRLVADLETIWKDEPQYFILLVGKNARARAQRLTERWVDLTADWIRFPRLL